MNNNILTGLFFARRREPDDALRIAPTSGELGCLNVHAFRSMHNPHLFYIRSRWRDEAAFELHVEGPHAVRFVERVKPLLDHKLDVERTLLIG